MVIDKILPQLEDNNIVLTCMLCLVLILVLKAVGQQPATQQHSPALLLSVHCRTKGHNMPKQPLKSNRLRFYFLRLWPRLEHFVEYAYISVCIYFYAYVCVRVSRGVVV